jgi:hypothetical protein
METEPPLGEVTAVAKEASQPAESVAPVEKIVTAEVPAPETIPTTEAAPDATVAEADKSALEASPAAAVPEVPAPTASSTAPAKLPNAEAVADVGEQPKEAPATSAPATPEPEIDVSSAAGLLAFAALLENGGTAPTPAKLAELMRESASRMLVLEGAIKEFGQALQMCNVISATSLRGGMAALGGESSPGSPDGHPAFMQKEEEHKSFMIKKGDADLQELHQKGLQRQISGGSNSGTCGGGGALSSTPVSKEDMAKARQARLQLLEKQQADKQKEKDEADERSRARDAMFSRRSDPTNVGAGKPLGKH